MMASAARRKLANQRCRGLEGCATPSLVIARQYRGKIDTLRYLPRYDVAPA
jgi:hypothetical protein